MSRALRSLARLRLRSERMQPVYAAFFCRSCRSHGQLTTTLKNAALGWAMDPSPHEQVLSSRDTNPTKSPAMPECHLSSSSELNPAVIRWFCLI